MNYHIARDGQQIGVHPKEEVLAKLKQGAIRPTDLVWCEGMADWKPASEVFAGEAAKPEPAPAQPAAAPAAPVRPAATPGAMPAKPENYLVWAILATILCCLPLGIVSIVFAAQVDSKYKVGDYQGAVDASNKAKMWAWWSFGVGLVLGLVVIALQFLAAASGGF